MPSTAWTISDLLQLDGKTAIVTGANSGIGLAAARALAGRGAHVILAVRDTDKGHAAAASLTGHVEVRRLDLADLASIRTFADTVTTDVDLLINNAGVMAPPLSRTRDGFELQFGTNHLGHFALTNLLLPRVTGRVVTVSSTAHRMGRIDFDDPNWRVRPYRRWAAYGQSKLANLLFTLELQGRLTATGSGVIAVAAHPGWAATNLQARSTSTLANRFAELGNRFIAQDADGGALPTLYAATAELRGGDFAGPGGFGELRGNPTIVGRTESASDPVAAGRLWSLSEELTGVGYPA